MHCWNRASMSGGSSDGKLNRQDGAEMCWLGDEKLSQPSFLQSSEIFFCAYSSVDRWLLGGIIIISNEAKRTDYLEVRELLKFFRSSSQKSQSVCECSVLSTYFHGSKRISCPYLCPSSCPWGRSQSAPLKEDRGLHLVYTPASNKDSPNIFLHFQDNEKRSTVMIQKICYLTFYF